MHSAICGKKLLVVGGAHQHIKVVNAAKKLGLKVYVADYLENSPAKLIADVPLLVDVNDVKQLERICIAEKIDGAIATSLDACQRPYQDLCEKMGYPCFGTKRQYEILTDKNEFKEFCINSGVDVIQTYSTEDVQNNRIIEYPLLIKPSDSRGSRGQTVCYSHNEAVAAIQIAANHSSTGEVVIEKYMEGCQDFTVSYLVASGEPIVVRTGDRFEGSKEQGLERLCIASCSPSESTEWFMNKINSKIVGLIKNIGILNGPVFFQGFIDGDKVRLYDPGLRFAGGEYEQILYEVTGIDIIEYLVEFAITGKDIQLDFDDSICLLNGLKLTQLDPTLKSGKIASIDGIEKIKGMKCVYSVAQRLFEGESVEKTNDLRQRLGEICILSNPLDERKNIIEIQKSLDVRDELGKNMIIDEFDVNLLRKRKQNERI